MNSDSALPDSGAEEQAALWAARLEGSELTAADRRELDSWLDGPPAHRALLSQYCQFSADLEQQLPLLEGIKDEAAEARKAPETALPRPWSRWPIWAGVTLTAAAAIALVAWRYHREPPVEDLVTTVAQRQTLKLADGSQVELNAQTSVRVEFTARERHLRLASGEAFFSVTKNPDRPFVVESPAGSVRVTGTKFAVRSELPGNLEVTVAEGSVQARPARSDGRPVPPVALTPGQQLSAGPGGVVVRTLSPENLGNALAWRQGQVVFADTPLHEALERFARYHGRGIVATPAAANLRLGGRFSLDDFEGFLAALEEVLPVRVTRDLSGTVQVDVRSTP